MIGLPTLACLALGQAPATDAPPRPPDDTIVWPDAPQKPERGPTRPRGEPSRFVFTGLIEPRFSVLPPLAEPAATGSFHFAVRLRHRTERLAALAVGYELELSHGFTSPYLVVRNRAAVAGMTKRRLFFSVGVGLGYFIPVPFSADVVARVGWAPRLGPERHAGLVFGAAVMVSEPIVRGGLPPIVTVGPFLGGSSL